MTTRAGERARLDTKPVRGSPVVTDDAVQRLPAPIQRLLRLSRVIGRPMPAAVRLRQRGHMRLRQGWPWLPFEARQVFTTDPPGFIWRATMKPVPGLRVTARDAFTDGHGRMTVTLAPSLKVVGECGPEFDQGELLRFLGELPWFPAAYVLPYLSWEPIDDVAARVAMTVGDVVASAVVRVAQDGSSTEVAAERYRTAGKAGRRLVPWSGTHTSFQEVNGLLLPARAEVRWHLPDGDFSYFRATVSDIEYMPANLTTRSIAV
jgi:hypothetical protein